MGLDQLQKSVCTARETTGWVGFKACRRCAACGKVKARHWSERAKREIVFSERTWFVTLTFRGSPDERYKLVQRGLYRLRTGGKYADTKTGKRVRYSGFTFRYLAVDERGDESGRFHYHLLIHCSGTVRKRAIKRVWPHGFSDVRLVRAREAGAYAAKASAYCSKGTGAGSRPRASVSYGYRLPKTLAFRCERFFNRPTTVSRSTLFYRGLKISRAAWYYDLAKRAGRETGPKPLTQAELDTRAGVARAAAEVIEYRDILRRWFGGEQITSSEARTLYGFHVDQPKVTLDYKKDRGVVRPKVAQLKRGDPPPF